MINRLPELNKSATKKEPNPATRAELDKMFEEGVPKGLEERSLMCLRCSCNEQTDALYGGDGILQLMCHGCNHCFTIKVAD